MQRKIFILTIIPLLLTSCDKKTGKDILNDLLNSNIHLTGTVTKTPILITENEINEGSIHTTYIDYFYDDKNQYFVNKDDYYDLSKDKVMVSNLTTEGKIVFNEIDVLKEKFINPFSKFSEMSLSDSKILIKREELTSFIINLYNINSQIYHDNVIYDLTYDFKVNNEKLTQITFNFKTPIKMPNNFINNEDQIIGNYMLYQGDINIEYMNLKDITIDNIYNFDMNETNLTIYRKLNENFKFPNYGLLLDFMYNTTKPPIGIFTYTDDIFICHNLTSDFEGLILYNYDGLIIEILKDNNTYLLDDTYCKLTSNIATNFDEIKQQKDYKIESFLGKSLYTFHDESCFFHLDPTYQSIDKEWGYVYDLSPIKSLLKYYFDDAGSMFNSAQLIYEIYNLSSENEFTLTMLHGRTPNFKYKLGDNAEYQTILEDEINKIRSDINQSI